MHHSFSNVCHKPMLLVELGSGQGQAFFVVLRIPHEKEGWGFGGWVGGSLRNDPRPFPLWWWVLGLGGGSVDKG